ncbi:MAG: hypothetical protein LUH02_03150, partial [Erysipelotrichaceae bacterium]|nr:hypothetical protein [Erysipelotrichaceae bacterium]
MAQNKEIDQLITMMLKQPQYYLVMKDMSKKKRREYVKENVEGYECPIVNDVLFKFMINGNDETSRRILKFFISEYLGIAVNKIVPLRSELNRKHKKGKTTILDALYLVNDYILVDIEPQTKMSSSKLLPKIESYLHNMFAYSDNIGNDESQYRDMYTLMFYETRYHGKFSKDLMIDSVTKDLKYSMSDIKRGPDEYSKQHATIVQLGYVSEKLEEEINNMSERKMVDYTLANSHILKGEVQNLIYEMSRKSQIVKDIMAKKLEFISDPRNRYISYNHAMDLQTKYYDGKDEEREIQRQNMHDVVIE